MKKKPFLICLAIVANTVDFKGKAAEPIVEEMLFENKTIEEGLVSFETDVKANTIFTETGASVVMQPYTSGAPTAGGGTLDVFDTVITPVKVMYYEEFDPETLRFSRFKQNMKPGAWEILSEEFERVVIGGNYARKISLDLEAKFWSNVLAATKTAVAALTAGTTNPEVSTAEKALVAGTTAGLFDGVVQYMIYNASNPAHAGAVGGRIKVAGTTITSTNIKAEYDKLYAAIVPETLQPQFTPYIYAPRSHKQLVNIFNNNVANYKDAFSVSDDKKTYFFNGVEIKFVPVPEKVMIAAVKENIIWCTDLESDMNVMKIDKIAVNREDYFIKNIVTLAAHVVNQKYNTLYVG